MNIEQIVLDMRDSNKKGNMRDLRIRISLLKKLKSNIVNCEKELIAAFKNDFNKCEFDAYTSEIGLVYEGINDMVNNLKRYAKPQRVKTSLFNFPSKGKIYAEPYGVVLVIGAWNYPFQLSMLPLIGAIGAGNCVVLKPSTKTPCVSAVIDKINKLTFWENQVVTVTTRENEGKPLLDVRFDYIFFTGGVKTGKKVMEAAAKHCIPLSLEMGGKSPCIVDKDCDIELTAKRITWGKFFNAGQTCICPDYILVHEQVYDRFVTEFIKQIEKQFYPNNNLIDTFPYLINEEKALEIKSLIDKEKVLFGGEINKRLMSPTVLGDVSWNSNIMQEEIFAPVAPLIKFSNIDEEINNINNREKPLALYYFGKSSQKIIQQCSFGGGCIYDTLMHAAEKRLPFGGVGYSGIGSYHGKQSFDTFTHYKSVLSKGKFDLDTRYSPTTQKDLNLAKKLLK